MCSLPDCSTAYYCSVPYLIYDVILFCFAHHRHQPGHSLLCSTTTTRPPKRHFLSFCSVQWSWFLFAFFFGDSFFTLCGLTCSICLPFAAFGLWTEEWWGYVMHTHNLFSFLFFCVQKRNFVLLFLGTGVRGEMLPPRDDFMPCLYLFLRGSEQRLLSNLYPTKRVGLYGSILFSGSGVTTFGAWNETKRSFLYLIFRFLRTSSAAHTNLEENAGRLSRKSLSTTQCWEILCEFRALTFSGFIVKSCTEKIQVS